MTINFSLFNIILYLQILPLADSDWITFILIVQETKKMQWILAILYCNGAQNPFVKYKLIRSFFSRLWILISPNDKILTLLTPIWNIETFQY
jgi:hypothetical protein